MFKGMTRAEVRSWAGNRIFGRGEEYIDNVYDLYRTEAGELVAWVEGTDHYAVRVGRSAKGLFDYECTCPYHFEGPCKHVVAVLLYALGTMDKLDELPVVDPKDDLWLELYDDDSEEEDDDDSEEDPDDDSEEDLSHKPKNNPPRMVDKQLEMTIEQALGRKTRDELLVILMNLTRDFPVVKEAILREQSRPKTVDFATLADDLRKEIRLKTSETLWGNDRAAKGHLPDYSHIKRNLKTLLAAGQTDLLIELGVQLWEQGSEQLQEANDDGQTALALADCMACVVRALPDSSLSIPEQILWRIDHALADKYGVVDTMTGIQSNPAYHPDHWRTVSNVLEQRLASTTFSDTGSYQESYARNAQLNLLIDAYARGDEESKIVPLLEQEADRCLCYDRLVQMLVDAGNLEQARQWCVRGYHHTIRKLPGIALALSHRLQEFALLEGRADLATAYIAHTYIWRPSMEVYEKLQRAAQEIHTWPAVRERVLGYLQTGTLPWKRNQAGVEWPLPPAEIEVAEDQKSSTATTYLKFPLFEELVRIALYELRHDDAVTIYDKFAKQTAVSGRFDDEVAKTVSASHPEFSLRIWRNTVDRSLGKVNTSGYRQASTYLQLMHQVYKDAGRLEEWETLLRQLRLDHKHKSNFIAELRKLEARISADS